MKTEFPERRTKVVTVHLEPNLHNAIKQIARRDGRPLSNMIRKLAEDRVRDDRPTLEAAV
jgi:predicted DNA-binding ribbon-helix-helix protein